MYNKTEISRLVAAALDSTGYVFNDGELQGESFEELLGWFSDMVDETHVDLTHVSGNDFAYFSEYVLTHAEQDSHTMPSSYFYDLLTERLQQIRDLAENDGPVDSFLPLISQGIQAAATWVINHFDDPDDLESELSIFDTEDGIGEVDEGDEFDENIEF
jgi:hypothetical protein